MEAKITEEKKKVHIQYNQKNCSSTQKEITHPIQYNQTKPHYSQQHGVSLANMFMKRKSANLCCSPPKAPMTFPAMLSAQ